MSIPIIVLLVLAVVAVVTAIAGGVASRARQRGRIFLPLEQEKPSPSTSAAKDAQELFESFPTQALPKAPPNPSPKAPLNPPPKAAGGAVAPGDMLQLDDPLPEQLCFVTGMPASECGCDDHPKPAR